MWTTVHRVLLATWVLAAVALEVLLLVEALQAPVLLILAMFVPVACATQLRIARSMRAG